MLYLLDHGVPWDVLRGWSGARRLAACVITGEREGHCFDWEMMRYQGEI
ncbi:MAG: hypothetical protein ABF459_14335 [Gluconobacter cerinus]